MTYNKTNDNLFHDHNNIYKYSLSQKGKGGKETNLSNLISEQEMETLQNKEVTLEIKLNRAFWGLYYKFFSSDIDKTVTTWNIMQLL